MKKLFDFTGKILMGLAILLIGFILLYGFIYCLQYLNTHNPTMYSVVLIITGAIGLLATSWFIGNKIR